MERTVDAVLGREAQLVDGLTEAERAALAGLLDRLLREVAGRVSPGLPGPEPDPRGPAQAAT